MNKFCVIKYIVDEKVALMIVNLNSIIIIEVCKAPVSEQNAFLMTTTEGRYYFTEFITEEASLGEAVECYINECCRYR